MRILAIDDNLDILKLIQMTVEALGHTFESASDGRPGLELIRNNQYDMVILDLAMPVMTGLEVIDVLIEEDIVKKQPIVLFTASHLNTKDFGEKLLQKGIYEILAKPADIDQILEIIQRIESKSDTSDTPNL